MEYAKDFAKLRRNIIVGQIASLLVSIFGLVSIVLFVDPLLIRVPGDQAESYRGNWVWLLTGLLFIIFGAICMFIAGRWSRRLIWIYHNESPRFMKLSIEIDSDGDSTTYYAVLLGEPEGIKGPLWKVSLYSPGWNVRILTGDLISARVYFDPRSQRPAVIETEHGLLWSMAGSGAAEQVSNE